MAGIESSFLDYKNILATVLRKDAVWTDLAEACNKVLVKEVDERRRRLTATKDGQRNRKGDVLSEIIYLPEDGKPAVFTDTGEISPLIKGDVIPKAIITRVINNGNYFGQTDQIDYFEVEFQTTDRRQIKWLLPTQAPQERSQLISNAYALGFDFFNTNLSTKDYERLYEYLGNFWPQNGFSDNFIRFIGFIKNLKLEGLPLWSLDDGTDRISVLEVDDPSQKHASQGGQWYLTSHVELRIDVDQQNLNYPINLTELEELFYLFAPIMLVLERIVFSVNANLSLLMCPGGNITYYNSGFLSKTPLSCRLQIDYAYSGDLLYYDAGILQIKIPVPEKDFKRYRNHGLMLKLPLNKSIKTSQQTSFNLINKNGDVLFSTTDPNQLKMNNDGTTAFIYLPIEQLPVDLPDNFEYQLRSIVKYQNTENIFGKIQFSDGPYAQTTVFKTFVASQITLLETSILKPSPNKLMKPVYIKEPFIQPLELLLKCEGYLYLTQTSLLVYYN